MKLALGVAAALIALGILVYGSYRKGYSDAAAKATADHTAEFGSDWNGDPAIKHSASYSLGYARGHGAGYAETRAKDFEECGEKLSQVAVESGNTKIAAQLMVDGFIVQSQVEAALQKKRK